ncbi:uncharacterized protein K452DRAFT_355234 [Aplosporella prunicola CBS 121167]|uniref:Uncharacterized protein n=1 Tax=Aplosporella prunicola CBS 121167 TaxID=1176127 RepID=A0A6A6BU41_9PEZI|nr:uncharacterized protein K452DRAFT_355234 [Aplosporella prunicola CBS 121167]KAF2146785.1 hypothetical protein K452DRAFT_355234 [Aplosporella prunicola CBS 121167]
MFDRLSNDSTRSTRHAPTLSSYLLIYGALRSSQYTISEKGSSFLTASRHHILMYLSMCLHCSYSYASYSPYVTTQPTRFARPITLRCKPARRNLTGRLQAKAVQPPTTRLRTDPPAKTHPTPTYLPTVAEAVPSS